MTADIGIGHSVVLVHGIRTHATWYQEVRNSLQEHGFTVHLTNYGRFDLFRFLLPTQFFRRRAARQVFDQIRDAKKSDDNAKFSIIAHSFGTYVVSMILRKEFDLAIDRVIFAGSVVKYDFPFQQFSERFEGVILNEVAVRDPWPALAESVTTGYGAAGTFGFRRPRVHDAWNDGGHDAVLNATRCADAWIPFLTAGTVPIDRVHPKVPYWIRLLNGIRIKFFVLLAAVLAGALTIATFLWGAKPVTIQMYVNEESGWQLSDNSLAESINAELDQSCPLAWIFGGDCNGPIAEFVTGRSWRGVHRYDRSLNMIIFPEDLVYTYRDPERFWFDLAESFPNCIKIADIDGRLDISYDNRCPLQIRSVR